MVIRVDTERFSFVNSIQHYNGNVKLKNNQQNKHFLREYTMYIL